jgi:endonuclease/exonuclease/phosphatase family metal-dependent hydrolase
MELGGFLQQASGRRLALAQGGAAMRRSFFVFLIGVVAGTAWLVLQRSGVKFLRTGPAGRPESSAQTPFVPISIPADGTRNTIRIASFNIQVFGKAKIDQPFVIDSLVRIIQQFDIVAIQEVRSRDDDILPRFVESLNAAERHYDFVIGPRLGRTNSKEQYAFIFDQKTVEVDRYQLYTINDPQDFLHREPFVGWFRARGPPPDQAFTFSLVNIHTDPDEVQDEVNVLDDVFHAVRNDGRREDDVIIVGDFNADDRSLGELGRVANFFAAISNVATNTAGTRQFDNIIFDHQATSEYTGRAGVFDFLRAYGLTIETARMVSDHLPVWAEFSVLEGGGLGRVATRGQESPK